MSNLPVVVENGIPVALFEATAIDCSYPSVDAVHTDFVWSKPKYWALLKVGTMYLSILAIGEANPENPRGRETSSPVSIWNSGQWRYQRGIYEKFVNRGKEEQASENYWPEGPIPSWSHGEAEFQSTLGFRDRCSNCLPELRKPNRKAAMETKKSSRWL